MRGSGENDCSCLLGGVVDFDCNRVICGFEFWPITLYQKYFAGQLVIFYYFSIKENPDFPGCVRTLEVLFLARLQDGLTLGSPPFTDHQKQEAKGRSRGWSAAVDVWVHISGGNLFGCVPGLQLTVHSP